VKEDGKALNAHVPNSGWPALVLNADFRPLSYYPLSLWSWQDAIKAVFLERVNIVAQYDKAVHSPSVEMKLPSVVSLKTYVKPSTHPAFTRFNVFLRDKFSCQFCGTRDDLTFDHLLPLARRADDVGQRGRGLLGLQSEEGQHDAGRGRHVALADAVCAERAAPASQRAAVSAELPARQLARLLVLGHRAGAVTNCVTGQSRRNRGDHPRGDLILQVEHVFDSAVVAPSPRR
jgi:5-methylcytosine-specific restriction endonuclease McrA